MKLMEKLLGQGKAPAALSAPSTASLRRDPEGHFVLKLGGLLTKSLVDRIQEVGVRGFEKGADQVKVLIVLNGFQGWKQGDDWGDIDFFAQYEQKIAKIAVLGDPRWEDEMMLFLASGHRHAEVRYYKTAEEDRAMAWLKEG